MCFHRLLPGASEREKQIADLLIEKCDGNRNLIHTCVAMCAPTSNKDGNDPPAAADLSGGPGGLGFGSSLDAMSGAVSSAVDVLTSMQQSRSSDPADRYDSQNRSFCKVILKLLLLTLEVLNF